MNELIMTLEVNRLSYIFRKDGTITPCVRFIEPLQLPDGTYLRMLPLDPARLNTRLDATQRHADVEGIKEGDLIKITIPMDPVQQPYVDVVARKPEAAPCIPFMRCPVCQSDLHPSPTGMGICHNLSCLAQIAVTVLHFLATIRFSFTDVTKWILERLLSRGAIYSPVTLFQLSNEELSFTGEQIEHIQEFQRSLHQLRGTVSFSVFLNSIRRAFPMSDHELNHLCSSGDALGSAPLYEKVLAMPDILRLSQPELAHKWDRAMRAGNNTRTIQDLSRILTV